MCPNIIKRRNEVYRFHFSPSTISIPENQGRVSGCLMADLASTYACQSAASGSGGTHSSGARGVGDMCGLGRVEAPPLPPAPLASAGFLVAGLVASQYSNRFGCLLACVFCCGLVVVLPVLSVAMCTSSFVSECDIPSHCVGI